jgi:hypothetical protein
MVNAKLSARGLGRSFETAAGAPPSLSACAESGGSDHPRFSHCLVNRSMSL